MGYYRGGYFANGAASGYYLGTRGDPGFLSFVSGLASKAAGFLPGPAAGIASGILSHVPGGAAGRMGRVLTAGSKMIRAHPVLSGAAAAGVAATGAGIMARPRAGKLPMHMGGRRRRRMHVTNVRALRRAIRRCTGFAHLAKRVLRFTSPRPPRGRVTFRRAARKTAKLRA